MDSRGKTFTLVLISLLLTPLVTVQLALAQTTESGFDHFDFDPIGPQAVGVPFNVTISAKDQYNQTMTSYSKTNYWSTILIIPSASMNTSYNNVFGWTAVFVNGVLNREITLTRGGGETYINIWDGQKYETSNRFYVDGPGSLDHFEITPVSDRQTIGIPFNITVTAKDQFGQNFTSYNGVNTWTIFTSGDVWIVYNGGTIGPFVNGVWSGQITLTESTFSRGSSSYGTAFPAGRDYAAGAMGSFNTCGQKEGLPDRPEYKAWGKTNDFTIDWPITRPIQTPTPFSTDSPSPTPTPTIPELLWLVTLSFLLSIFSVAVVLRNRRQKQAMAKNPFSKTSFRTLSH